MTASRVPAQRGKKIDLEFEGELIEAYEGETVAAALMAADVRDFGTTRDGDPRAPLCNMGTCFDCAVTVDGRQMIRACLVDVEDGMRVKRTEAC